MPVSSVESPLEEAAELVCWSVSGLLFALSAFVAPGPVLFALSLVVSVPGLSETVALVSWDCSELSPCVVT